MDIKMMMMLLLSEVDVFDYQTPRGPMMMVSPMPSQVFCGMRDPNARPPYPFRPEWEGPSSN